MNSSKELPSNNGARAAQGRFAQGNKLGKGRPHGSRNNVTLALDQILEIEAKSIARKAIELALNGDVVALRLCLDRLCPPKKDWPIVIDIPPIKNVSDTVRVMGMIVTAVANGEITPREGMALAGVIEVYRKTIETNEIAVRIVEIEAQMRGAGI